MRQCIPLTAIAVVAGLTLLAACGGSSGSAGPSKPDSTTVAPEVNPAGDIPDTQVYVPYSPESGGYTVTVPEGWARTDLPNGAVFTDNFNSVRVEKTAAATAPTTLSVQADVVPQLRADGASVISGGTHVVRKAGNALLITYLQDSTPDPTTGKKVVLADKRYAFWKNGTLVTLTLSGAKGADNVDPWRTVTNSFAWSP